MYLIKSHFGRLHFMRMSLLEMPTCKSHVSQPINSNPTWNFQRALSEPRLKILISSRVTYFPSTPGPDPDSQDRIVSCKFRARFFARRARREFVAEVEFAIRANACLHCARREITSGRLDKWTQEINEHGRVEFVGSEFRTRLDSTFFGCNR